MKPQEFKKFDQLKLVRFIEAGELLKLKHYLIKMKKEKVSCNLDFKANKKGHTPLHIAAAFGDDAIVRCLIKNGASVCARDHELNYPLHLAAKCIMDNNTYATHKLLINPLLEKDLRICDALNREGKTPKDYLTAAKEHEELIREVAEREKKTNASGDEDENENKDGDDLTEQSWNEKLANQIEADCADVDGNDHNKFDGGTWKEPKMSTFDEWADHISQEYSRKHKFDDYRVSSTRRTKRQKMMDKREAYTRVVREVELYREAQHQRKIKDLNEKHQKYQDTISKMKNQPKSGKLLKFSDIPWPCKGSVDEMAEVMMKGLSPCATAAERKKYVLKQLLLWHPDKFAQRCANLLNEGHKEAILDTVRCLSQKLTTLKDEEPVSKVF